MARPPMFSVQEKQRIVLSVLRGECTVAEAARRNKCSETSITKWRDQFVQAGLSALEAQPSSLHSICTSPLVIRDHVHILRNNLPSRGGSSDATRLARPTTTLL
jgi:transposase-like protein